MALTFSLNFDNQKKTELKGDGLNLLISAKGLHPDPVKTNKIHREK